MDFAFKNCKLRFLYSFQSNSKKFSDFSESVVIQSNLFRVSPVPFVTSNRQTEIQDSQLLEGNGQLIFGLTACRR